VFTDAPPSAEPESAATGPRQRVWRRVAAWVTTGLAALLVLFGLVAPNRLDHLAPAVFLRIPVEALIGVAILVVLPARARRVVAVVAGAALGLLTILKLIDMGFNAAFSRPFDPILDWGFLSDAVEVLARSIGRAGATIAAIVAVLVALGVPVLMALSARRLARLVAGHRTPAIRTVAVLGIAWLACALLGAQIVPHEPIASDSAAVLAYDHLRKIPADLRDPKTFADQLKVDAFANTPGNQLLTGLRGKDVLLTFVESYGRIAQDDPEFAGRLDPILDEGNRQLRAAGFTARSAYITSPIMGGGSWQAHAALQTGLWVDNPQRYATVVGTQRLSLTRAFKRAGWQTVAMVPANDRDWPEASFYGYDRTYDSRNLPYHGPRFALSSEPDQYTMSAFQRLERSAPDHAPVMAEIDLLSSHSPWTPVPKLIDWDKVGVDGSGFTGMPNPTGTDLDSDHIRAAYIQSIAYSVSTLVSYVQKYGDDNLVLIFLGDHQPAPVVIGDTPNRDAPITIVAKDPNVLNRIAAWGWEDGLRPDGRAPVWHMDIFRDRFLTTFGSTAH
jgi:hypothetical protein